MLPRRSLGWRRPLLQYICRRTHLLLLVFLLLWGCSVIVLTKLRSPYIERKLSTLRVDPVSELSELATRALELEQSYSRASIIQAHRAFFSSLHNGMMNDTSLRAQARTDRLAAYMRHMGRLLGGRGKILECVPDPSLPGEPPRRNAKYLLAANLHNSQAVLPNMIWQLLQLAVHLPPGALFVSVYESGSTDDTAYWLRVLRVVLSTLGVEHNVDIDGAITRNWKHDRIEFLSRVRNAALQPLLPQTSDGTGEPAASPTVGNSGSGGVGGVGGTPVFPADTVIFLNDVFFCWRDILRLLHHRADMACGVDLQRLFNSLRHSRRQDFMIRHLREYHLVPRSIGRWLSRYYILFRAWRAIFRGHMVMFKQLPLLFYDIWVSRDLEGRRYTRESPYVNHNATAERLAAGLPVPAQCCWNGLVAIDGRVFSVDRAQFRMHRPEECPASECSLLCADMLQLGYKNILVDPGVRTAYHFIDAVDMHTPLVERMNDTTWAQVQAAPSYRTLGPVATGASECCPKEADSDFVDFNKCHMEPLTKP